MKPQIIVDDPVGGATFDRIVKRASNIAEHYGFKAPFVGGLPRQIHHTNNPPYGHVIIAVNLSEHTWYNYQIGLPNPGQWNEAFNSDVYDNWVNPWRQVNGGMVLAKGGPLHDFLHSAEITLPANSVSIFTV